MRIENDAVRFLVKKRQKRNPVVELSHGEQIKLLCPVSQEGRGLRIRADSSGKLLIEGDFSIVERISGLTMKEIKEKLKEP